MAKDVCACLDLKARPQDESFTHHTNKLGKDEAKTIRKTSMPDMGVFPGSTAWVRVISESGLYKLIMRSDKASARPFQDWVTRVVLPVIRRTGGWRVDATAS